jgi:hypothetical protein
MIENISTMEELGDWWTSGEGNMLMDKQAGRGLRHVGDVVFTGSSTSLYWYGHVRFLAPDRDEPTDYVELMGRFGIRLTASAVSMDSDTPRRHRVLTYTYIMIKEEWPLMAVREKLSA